MAFGVGKAGGGGVTPFLIPAFATLFVALNPPGLLPLLIALS